MEGTVSGFPVLVVVVVVEVVVTGSANSSVAAKPL